MPHLPHPLELADVEGVQTDELAGALGLHVPGAPVAQPPQRLAGPFGQQPGPLGAVMLEHEQTLPPGGQPVPASNRCTVLAARRRRQRRWA